MYYFHIMLFGWGHFTHSRYKISIRLLIWCTLLKISLSWYYSPINLAFHESFSVRFLLKHLELISYPESQNKSNNFIKILFWTPHCICFSILALFPVAFYFSTMSPVIWVRVKSEQSFRCEVIPAFSKKVDIAHKVHFACFVWAFRILPWEF